MKNIFGLLSFFFFFVACQQKIKPTDIAKINGYWEIQKVVFKEGKDKDYKFNDSYDFFEIGKNNVGIRKKVMPQLDGTFLVNDTYEKIKVRFENDKAFLDYTTPYAKWSEELITLSGDELVLKNAEMATYHYKKTGPINLIDDGKKTE